MTTLRAILPVLYRSVQYRPGDALPADNQPTVEAWLEFGAAKWIDDEEITKAKEAPKAEMVSEEPGMEGISSDGDPDALVGKVPKRAPAKRGKAKK